MREYLKKLREEKKWPQAAVAQKIAVSQTYYGYIENGTRQQRMTYVMMEKLASAFSVPVGDIIKLETDYLATTQRSSQ